MGTSRIIAIAHRSCFRESQTKMFRSSARSAERCSFTCERKPTRVFRACQEITDLFGSPAGRPNRVVPVAMETMPLEQDRRHLRVRDRHAARVATPIDLGPDAQS